jgi:hypothetical protein
MEKALLQLNFNQRHPLLLEKLERVGEVLIGGVGKRQNKAVVRYETIRYTNFMMW